MTVLARSWLYCPATRAELFHKALAGEADAVVIDLEDAVPPHAKSAARSLAVEALALPRNKPVWVRMNPLNSPWGEDDAKALAAARPDGVRVPKCVEVSDVREVASLVDCPVAVLVETASGVENAGALATADPRVASISLGEADLMADLRVRRSEALDWARQRVVVAARAAGLPSPTQSVHTAIGDEAGLRATTLAARDAGHFGRSVIHPRQIGIVNEVFTPDAEEVAAAQAVLRALPGGTDRDHATGLDPHGRFVDPAVAEQAAWVVELSAAIRRHQDQVNSEEKS